MGKAADAKHLLLRLKDAPEAEDQIAFADAILLNKVDLVTAEELAEVESAIRTINPRAVIHRTERAEIDLAKVLDIARILQNDPDFLGPEKHHHHDHDCSPDCDHEDHDHHKESPHDTTITSVSLRGGPLNSDLFFLWINKITQIDGPDILRLKGIVAFDNDPDRYVVQGIHMIVEGDHQRAWRDDEKRESRIVFIGRNLDHEKLTRTFRACEA